MILLLHKQKMLMKGRKLGLLALIVMAAQAGAFAQSGAATDLDWSVCVIDDTLDLYLGAVCAGRMIRTISYDASAGVINAMHGILIDSTVHQSGAMSMIERRRYDTAGDLTHASQQLRSPAGESRWELTGKDGGWNLAITTGGETRVRPVDEVHDNLRTAYAIRRAILDKTAKVGDHWSDTTFDMTAGERIVSKTVVEQVANAETGEHWVLVSKDDIVRREERWELDSEGRTILQEAQPLFVARRGGRESPGSGAEKTMELSEIFTIPAAEPVRRGERIALRFDAEARLHESVRHLYEVRDGLLVLREFPEACPDSGDGVGDRADKRYLAATATMQADNPEIVALAKRLRARSEGVCDFVEKTAMYVYRTIEKRNVATYSNAVETLRAGFGDCGEHAALCAAILRAGGVDARLALGLVYIPAKKAYMYHAWVMALAGGWFCIDPALGRVPAARGYIPLVLDDTGRNNVHLASSIARLSVSYVSAAQKKVIIDRSRSN